MDLIRTYQARLISEWPATSELMTTHSYPMMSHWSLCVAPPLFYLASVFLLRRLMRARATPIDVPLWFQALHNLFLVLLSLYMASGLLYQAYALGYGLLCNQVVPGPAGKPMADILWVFTVSKLYEFLDTYIMILRKKDEQVTFLHVYHHASIYAIWWLNIKHFPGGEAYQSAAMNSIVHIVMYAYYFLRTVAPGGNYWWKRYITQMQIIQFVLFVGQGIALLYYACVSFPITLINELYAWSLLALFAHFYIDGYVRKPRDRINVKKRN